MSVDYDFSVASDFPSGVDSGALQDELFYDFGFATLLGVSVGDDLCRITFSAALTAGQETTLAAARAAHDGQPKPFAKKHYEQEFDNSRLVRETWWARASGDALSLKVEETLYTYSGSRLMAEQFKSYNRDGSVASERNWIFRQEKVGTTLRVRKVEQ